LNDTFFAGKNLNDTFAGKNLNDTFAGKKVVLERFTDKKFTVFSLK
jgi:hypothetical protein